MKNQNVKENFERDFKANLEKKNQLGRSSQWTNNSKE